jgi:Pyruvate/2-oxoacid:ferredoxin oxidoreductase gamma subunit
MEIADRIGSPKAGNMIMLGAFLETSGGLPEEFVDGALRRLVKSERWVEVDRAALARGREIAREAGHVEQS